MKKLIHILFFSLLLGFTSKAQVKIGKPAGAPQSSAVLDLSNTDDLTPRSNYTTCYKYIGRFIACTRNACI